MSEAREQNGKTRRVRRCRIGCDRLALILGAMAWISFVTMYTFDPRSDLWAFYVFGIGSIGLNVLGLFVLIVSSVRERRWSAHYFAAVFLIFPQFAIFAVGMWIVVFYGGV